MRFLVVFAVNTWRRSSLVIDVSCDHCTDWESRAFKFSPDEYLKQKNTRSSEQRSIDVSQRVSSAICRSNQLLLRRLFAVVVVVAPRLASFHTFVTPRRETTRLLRLFLPKNCCERKETRRNPSVMFLSHCQMTFKSVFFDFFLGWIINLPSAWHMKFCRSNDTRKGREEAQWLTEKDSQC